MSEDVGTPVLSETSQRAADLEALNRLVGRWRVTGGAVGETDYEWMDGGFSLVQRVNLEQYGQQIRGIEIIGHLKPFGEEPEPEIRSRFYGNTGDTLDYVYELEGDTLTIWGGEKGSPAYYKGRFSEDGKTLEGSWVYPDGGGYDSRAARMD